jgi:hypothetical protein
MEMRISVLVDDHVQSFCHQNWRSCINVVYTSSLNARSISPWELFSTCSFACILHWACLPSEKETVSRCLEIFGFDLPTKPNKTQWETTKFWLLEQLEHLDNSSPKHVTKRQNMRNMGPIFACSILFSRGCTNPLRSGFSSLQYLSKK